MNKQQAQLENLGIGGAIAVLGVCAVATVIFPVTVLALPALWVAKHLKLSGVAAPHKHA